MLIPGAGGIHRAGDARHAAGVVTAGALILATRRLPAFAISGEPA